MVLVAFVNLTLQPLAMALQHETGAKAVSAPKKEGDEKYSEALEALKAQAAKLAKLQTTASVSADDEGRAVKALRKLARDLEALEPEVDAQFAAIGRHLDRNNLAPEIKQRHEEAKRLFKDKQDGMKRIIGDVDKGDDGNDRNLRVKGVSDLMEFLKAHSTVRRGTLDPNNLPWRTPKAEVRAPIETEAGFKSAKFGHVRAKSAGTPVAAAPTAQPGPEYLAATIDVQLTPAILARAQELGGQPLSIYQWVRNNVEFFPSYGSVQGSDDTLAKLRGNAFDTSSLLIALLRASGIPARYVIGTVDVPVSQAMNWAGGVGNIAAAQQVLGQGGIPTRLVVSGGQATHLRMEHTWVEAWVDFVPSRGAKHVQGNTWVPLDASFKEYATKAGMNIKAGVPFDAASFEAAARQGATINAQEGSVQNLNLANIRANLAAQQGQIQAYVSGQKANATVGEVIGARTIVPDTAAQLAGTLRNRVVVVGSRLAELPGSLRHRFSYSLYASDFDRSLDSPVWNYSESLPSLAGKKLTLTFRPASQADADLIASFVPKPHADGTAPLPSEIPRVLPSYANVVPELRVEGEVKATGTSFRLGTELVARGGFTQYDFSGWDLTNDDSLVAGQISALGLNLQGVSRPQVERLQARLHELEAALDRGASAGLDAERFTGDILSATLWGYYGAMQGHGRVAESQANMVDREGLSYGLFHAVVQPNKLYGFITTSVRMPGVLMDIGHLRHIRWEKNSDAAAWVRYNRMRGQAASALEHAMPERFFTDATTCNIAETPTPDPAKPPCPEGVSAVKAIGIAMAQGQKVYTITQANSQVINALSLRSDTLAEIASAVAAGKEVTVHERPVSANGWTGAGYTVIDLATGAGGYLIEGAANGAVFATFGAAFVGVIGMFLLTAGVGPVIFAALLISLAIHVAIIALSELIAEGAIDPMNVYLGSTAALSLIRALAMLFPALVVVPAGAVMAIILLLIAIIAFTRIR